MDGDGGQQTTTPVSYTGSSANWLTPEERSIALGRAEKTVTSIYESQDTTVGLLLSGSILFLAQLKPEPKMASNTWIPVISNVSAHALWQVIIWLVIGSILMAASAFWMRRNHEGTRATVLSSGSILTS